MYRPAVFFQKANCCCYVRPQAWVVAQPVAKKHEAIIACPNWFHWEM